MNQHLIPFQSASYDRMDSPWLGDPDRVDPSSRRMSRRRYMEGRWKHKKRRISIFVIVCVSCSSEFFSLSYLQFRCLIDAVIFTVGNHDEDIVFGALWGSLADQQVSGPSATTELELSLFSGTGRLEVTADTTERPLVWNGDA